MRTHCTTLVPLCIATSLTIGLTANGRAFATNATTECIGNYTITMPAEIEYALTSPEFLIDYSTARTEHLFPDNQEATYSHPYLDNSPLRVTTNIKQTDFARMDHAIDSNFRKTAIQRKRLRLPIE